MSDKDSPRSHNNTKIRHFLRVHILPLIALFLLLLNCCICFKLNYKLQKSTQNCLNTTSPATYLIWTDHSIIYAKNCLTNTIDFSGKAAAIVINHAINITHENGGGLVFIKSGNYNIDSSIILKSYVTLEGEGSGEQKAPTVLKLANNINDDVIKTPQQKNYHVTIRNLQIDGNNGYQTQGSGIHIYATDRPLIEHVTVKWCKSRGIHIEGFQEETSIAPQIKSVYVWGCGEQGIMLSATDSFIQNVDIGHDYTQEDTEPALYLYWAHKSVIANSFFWGSKHGVYIDQTNSTLLTGCIVEYNRYEGIVLHCSSNNVIDGNEIVHNSQSGVGCADGIYLVGSGRIPCNNNTISNNFIGEDRDSQQYHRYAINEEGPHCNSNLIIGNNVNCYYRERIRWNGPNTIVCNNIGYVTENTGTATGTSPIYVLHGLSQSPTCVTLTVKGITPYETSWNNYNSTHIAIYHNAGKDISITVTWYAKYEP